jgi:hypothetical protein
MRLRPRASDASALAAAAYGLALRTTGDEARAVESVDAALQRRRASEAPAVFLGAVRAEARARRAGNPDPATAPRPQRLAFVPSDDWAVLERVALRGMPLTEAAEAVGIDRREALLRLHRGLAAARSGLLGERKASDEPRSVGCNRLDRDLAACGLDNAARDRQP